MQEANNIQIILLDFQIPFSKGNSQTIDYHSLSDAVGEFEIIRSHASIHDSESYAAQLYVDDMLVSEYFLDQEGFTISLTELGTRN